MKRYRTMIDDDGLYPRDRELLEGEEWETEPDSQARENPHLGVASEVYRFARTREDEPKK
jgi:hypothetical protein